MTGTDFRVQRQGVECAAYDRAHDGDSIGSCCSSPLTVHACVRESIQRYRGVRAPDRPYFGVRYCPERRGWTQLVELYRDRSSPEGYPLGLVSLSLSLSETGCGQNCVALRAESMGGACM